MLHQRLAVRTRACAGFFLYILLHVPATAGVHAQQPAAVRGSVYAGEAPVAAAEVRLLRDTTVVLRTQTDDRGTFELRGIAAGRYGITAERVGYGSSGVQMIDVARGGSIHVRLELPLSPVQLDSLAVEASIVRIDPRSTEFSTRVAKEQIRILPLAHDPASIVELTPGARAGHVWGGATAQANNYQIDGLAANHPGAGGDLVQLSMNWVERVEVRGLGAGAEHGNFQGGLVNVVTKSGSNERYVELRSTAELHHLNGSNLERTEIGSEVNVRHGHDAEISGPILRDRLFYYLAGQYVSEKTQHLNHLGVSQDRYSPVLSSLTDLKGLAKLTWRPGTRDRLDATLIRMDAATDRAGNTGYETAEATWDQNSTASLLSAHWQHDRGWLQLEGRVARINAEERRDAYGGSDVPGVQLYSLLPPARAYQNAPLSFEHAPSSTSGSLAATFRFALAGAEHSLKLGGEHTMGRHVDRRVRNGGLTWRPIRRPSFDPADPSTWRISPGYPFVAVTTGGEVDLDADVENSALYAQGSFALGSRITINPGVRWGRWAGYLTPAGNGDRFRAVHDHAIEPRIGVIVDATGNNSFVLKGHWGRYHQSMIAQFFDRVEGGNVFTDEEVWHYGGPLDTSLHTLTAEDWQRYQDEGLLTRQRTMTLTESGPVMNYSQPFVDQWLLGVEKSFPVGVKLEALYVRRSNRNMVALVDRNAATNYTRFEYVNVLSPQLEPLNFEGGVVQLRELYVPNNRMIEVLRLVGRGECMGSCAQPPGFVAADTLNLSWNPEYVLTNVPDARREFEQLQLTVLVDRPTWGASASVVFTDLEGNLDSVTGYDDPAGYGAGPYVRVNEAVNAYGKLPNFSEREVKLSLYSDILWDTRGGIFWTWSAGDHYSPHYTFFGRDSYRYRLYYTNEAIDPYLVQDLEGHRVFLGPRGRPTYEARGLLDLRLERSFQLGTGRTVAVTLDVFNLLNTSTVTRVNTSANLGRNYYYFLGPDVLQRTDDPNEYYKAVLERVTPRTLRLGTAIRF